MKFVTLNRCIWFWRIGKCLTYNDVGASEYPDPLLVSFLLRIALGSDDCSPVVDFVAQDLQQRGHQVQVHGPDAWPDVAEVVAREVADGNADEGVLFCWTGTGVSIAANKVQGARAALCQDAETARGAKAWNQANVLCLSLRTTTEAVAREILDAWFSTPPDPVEGENVKKINDLDARYREGATAPLSGRPG
jgi:ribose 5-phosphate isomerase B